MKNNLTGNDRVVWMLKTRGPQPLAAIATEMKVTTEGARFQLLKLANEGLVESITESKGRGRPQQIWSLTSAGQARFPDTHAELTVKLIRTIKETLGQKALDTIIEANGQSGVDKYLQELKGIQGLENKVAQLAGVRDREGYMAEYEKDEEGYLLIENHCPICAAATECQNFCLSELNTFRTVLGENVIIKRVDHILSGSRRCAYRIQEK
jgi:predicted ArsR family transcriptional regulator